MLGPNTRRIASLVVASGVLVGGIAAGSTVAIAAPSGSAAPGAGSSSFQIPDLIADPLAAILMTPVGGAALYVLSEIAYSTGSSNRPASGNQQ
ncbi:hypothetical protein ACWFRB_10625 [Rhodococcus sp. NPDC055112]